MDNNTNLVDFLNGTAYVVRPPVDAIQEFKVETNDYSAETDVRPALSLMPPSSLEPTSSTDPRGSSSAMTCLMQRTSLKMREAFQRRIPPEPIRFHHRRSDSARQNFLLRGLRRHAHPAGAHLHEHGSHGSRAEHWLYQSLGTALPRRHLRPRRAGANLCTGASVRSFYHACNYLRVADPVTGITAPCTGVPAGTQLGFVREPFAGNMIPANRLDSNAIKLLNLYPAPTNSGLFNNYAADPISSNNSDQFDVRVDHTFSEKDNIFGRFSYVDNPSLFRALWSIADGGSFSDGTQTSKSLNAVASETHVFSPSLVMKCAQASAGCRPLVCNPMATRWVFPISMGFPEFLRSLRTAVWDPSSLPV